MRKGLVDITMVPAKTAEFKGVATQLNQPQRSNEIELGHTAKPGYHLRPSYGLRASVVVGVIVLLAVGYVTFQHMSRDNVAAPQVAAATTVIDVPQTVDITSHMMFVGDVFWGRAIETAAVHSGIGPANLFRGLTPADKQGYDAWVGDMECPVTDKNIPYRTQVDSLIFNCRPEYASAAARWFDVMTLANNHTDNNGGSWGLDQTRQNLDKAGIQYFGTYNMHDEADICEVIAVKAHETQDITKTFQIPVAMCGYDYVGSVTPSDSQLGQMIRYSKVMPVFAMPHMGVEYRATAEDAKVAVYHRLIDSGADVVIGAHPHVVQNTESYKGRLIAYSVGNFLFDQQILGRDTTETLGVGVALQIHDVAAIDAYKSVAASCSTYKDDCLRQLEQKITKRPEIVAKYDFQCFDESTGTPVRASEAVCQQIKDRATISQLTNLATSW